MNIENFRENLELMGHSGFRLTEMEATAIENSLILLKNQNKLREIFFFGRFDTSISVRYYIAFGYETNILKKCTFFYSFNGYEWIQMPEFNLKLIPITLESRTLLSGDPMNVEIVTMHPKFIENNRDIKIPCAEKIKRLKEENKLACLVHLIMNESAMLPRGALYRQTTGDLALNTCFNGLSHTDVSDMKNFQLLRYPQNNQNYNLTKRANYNYQTDFLDTIDDIIPGNCFSRTINDRDVCIVRALNWPGMVFVHKLNTKNYAFFYFGNGRRNLDHIFMTQIYCE